MVIRCERCSILYELDEALLSPGGSQVQCTRCQHVFTAYPTRAAGRTLVGVPAQAAAEPTAQVTQSESQKTEVPPAGPRTAAAAAGAPAPKSDPPRAIRSGPPPVYRPPTSPPPPTSGRAPLLKRDTVGTFENRLRWSARLRWLAPLLAVGAVAVVVAAAWWLLGRRGEPDGARTSTDAMSLLALDDAASVEQAIARLDAILRRTPKHRVAATERALAYVLRAAALVDEGESLAAKASARSAERERLGREQAEGWQEADRAAAADVKKLEGEARAREERGRALGGAALQALRQLQSEPGNATEVARGLAAYYALGGERDRARKVIRAAREQVPADPWLDLAEAWTDARDADRAGRERALIQLGALSAAHPELLRARYLLARTEAALGRQVEAIATLDALLAVNARHEGGKRLRDALRAPPAASGPLPPAPPPPANPAPQPRKLVTHTVPAPAPVPSVTVLPPLGPASEPQDARPARSASAPSQGPTAPNEAPAPPASAGHPAPAPGPAAPGGASSEEAPPPRPEPRRDRGPPSFTDGE